jgi:FlaA1/EpsC-like NDP-sugar epimerase
MNELVAKRLRGILQYDRAHKRAIVLSLDIALCFLSSFVAFSLRVGALDFPAQPYFLFTFVAAVAFIPIFFWAGAYAAIFRFASGSTIRDLARATAVYAIPLVACFMIAGVAGVPRTIALLHPFIFFGFTSVSRMLMRQMLAELRIDPSTGRSVRRAMIYGAGSAGLQLAMSLQHAREILLVGFIDDDARLQGQRLEGVTVHHSAGLEDIIDDEEVDTVLLALPNAGRGRWREIIERLRPLPVQVKTLPQIQHVVEGRVSFDDLRGIQIEDLLGRDSVAPNEILLGRTIVGKSIMVTGAGGSIGSELCRQIVTLHPRRLVLVEMTEHALYQIESELRAYCAREGQSFPIEPELLTLLDQKAVSRAFDLWRPDTVFHAAAYKHVPLVERNPISGLCNNIIGTRNAVLAAEASGVDRFILISTDKAVRPTNVMGASKRVCELILQAQALSGTRTRFAMVRFGNVLGSSGSVVPHFKQQIREGGPVTVTHRDVTRYFMTIPEAAQLVIQAGALAEGGEVFLLDMGESVRIFDLARTMIELSGLSVRDEENPSGDIEIVEIGLRPGEKLFEELLIDAEAKPTGHSQIRQARERALERKALDPLLEELIAATVEGNCSGALKALGKLVPEYSEQLARALANEGTS